MTKVALVRHGMTDWNLQGRIQGIQDIPLNEEGRSQARAVARRLGCEEWHRIYSSDLLRAAETARMVADVLKLPVILDSRLREKAFGQVEGTTEEERLQRWGAGWRELSLGVEEDLSIRSRGRAFLEEIVRKHPGENVIAVTHGAFIHQLMEEMLPEDTEWGHLGNTSVSVLSFAGGRWEPVLLNCTAHLP